MAAKYLVRHGGRAICLVAILVAHIPTAQAACPVELSVYEDSSKMAGIDFRPTGHSMVVTNTFRMNLRNGIQLDGIVMWSKETPRPYASLHYQCPEGDVTGEEIAECTLWEGPLYAVGQDGKASLMPAEATPAPQALILPDLGPALHQAAIFGEDAKDIPEDIFRLSGCQE
ncbi:hypothetical protein ACFPLB_02710 [Aquamicrobium segne]|uniref:Uncharacterized protein n=1 Tax=Aquamicrobium segne TaxID=469547 RepID=A0ABW0GVI6_9HYPH